MTISGGRTKQLDIFCHVTSFTSDFLNFIVLKLIQLDIFLFPPITQWCSISDVLFTGGRGVSDFSVLKILLVKY